MPALSQSLKPREAPHLQLTTTSEISLKNLADMSSLFEDVATDSNISLFARLSKSFERGLPVVAGHLDGSLVGFAACFQYRFKQCYSRTCETAVYINDRFRGQGLGGLMLDRLCLEGQRLNLRTFVAVINDEKNVASVSLHRRAGYEVVGRLTNVGERNGSDLTNVLMQRDLFK